MANKDNPGTTGHQWDDEEGFPLTEYNNPLPTWWLYTFYATIVFAVIYWFFYPAWPLPGGFTQGSLGWSQYKQLDEELAQAAQARKGWDDKLAALSLQDIAKDNELLQYATAGGKTIFGDNCAPCHGSGGAGNSAKGFPVLADDDWLYGGTLEAINQTVNFGRAGMMPAHLEGAGGSLKQEQITDLVEFVTSLSGKSKDAAAVERGKKLFTEEAGCVMCHGEHGGGSLKDTAMGGEVDDSFGAPNLSDAIWLYGGDPATIAQSIAQGRGGKMPAWGEGFSGFGRKLDPLAIKKVVLYVHSLGGGQ